jgi:hypothetical protein
LTFCIPQFNSAQPQKHSHYSFSLPFFYLFPNYLTI